MAGVSERITGRYLGHLSLRRTPIRVVDVYNIDRAAHELQAHRAALINESGRYENVIVCSAGPFIPLMRERGIQVSTAPIPRSIVPTSILRGIQQFANILRREKATIVHSHGPYAGVCARLAAHLAGVPFVIHTVHGFHFHERMDRVRRSVYIEAERFLARFTDILLFQIQEDLEESYRYGIRARRANLKIGNGIDLHRYLTPSPPSECDPPVILMVARFESVKNQTMLLRAAGLLMTRGVQFQIWFAGCGDTLGQCRYQAGRLGLNNHVQFLGYVDDIGAIVRKASLAVLTSLKEGIPRGLLEPMASRVPVIATDVKGNRETVVHGQTGLLVPFNDDHALANAIEQLLKHRVMRRRMGAAAACWVRKHFDESQVVDRLLAIYDALLDRSQLQRQSNGVFRLQLARPFIRDGKQVHNPSVLEPM